MTHPSTAPQKILLLHGFAGLRQLNWPLARMLTRNSYHPIMLGYNSWGRSLDAIRDTLLPALRAADEAAQGPLHIIAHSMGGLVARALLTAYRPRHLGHVIMLGTPNGGSEIADHLARNRMLRGILGQARPALVTDHTPTLRTLLGIPNYSLGIIAGDRPFLPGPIARLIPGPSDGKVSVASTHLDGASDHIVLPLSHTELPYHPSAHRQILHFLEHGRFNPRTRPNKDRPGT